MRLWAKIGLTFILIVVGFGVLQAVNPKPEVSIECRAKGDSGDCRVENKGGVTADVDVNVVVVCHDGEHLAHLSARVDARSHQTKVIESFEPSVGFLTKCAGIDYRNFQVRPTAG